MSLVWVWSWSFRSVCGLNSLNSSSTFTTVISCDGFARAVPSVSSFDVVWVWLELVIEISGCPHTSEKILNMWACMQILMQKEGWQEDCGFYLTITVLDTLDHQDSENTPHECFVGLIQKIWGFTAFCSLSSAHVVLPAGKHKQWISTLLVVDYSARW